MTESIKEIDDLYDFYRSSEEEYISLTDIILFMDKLISLYRKYKIERYNFNLEKMLFYYTEKFDCIMRFLYIWDDDVFNPIKVRDLLITKSPFCRNYEGNQYTSMYNCVCWLFDIWSEEYLNITENNVIKTQLYVYNLYFGINQKFIKQPNITVTDIKDVYSKFNLNLNNKLFNLLSGGSYNITTNEYRQMYRDRWLFPNWQRYRGPNQYTNTIYHTKNIIEFMFNYDLFELTKQQIKLILCSNHFKIASEDLSFYSISQYLQNPNKRTFSKNDRDFKNAIYLKFLNDFMKIYCYTQICKLKQNPKYSDLFHIVSFCNFKLSKNIIETTVNLNLGHIDLFSITINNVLNYYKNDLTAIQRKNLSLSRFENPQMLIVDKMISQKIQKLKNILLYTLIYFVSYFYR